MRGCTRCLEKIELVWRFEAAVELRDDVGGDDLNSTNDLRAQPVAH